MTSLSQPTSANPVGYFFFLLALFLKYIKNPTTSHLYLLSSSHYYLPTELLQQPFNWFPCICPNTYLTFNLNTAVRDILSVCKWNHTIPLLKILQ